MKTRVFHSGYRTAFGLAGCAGPALTLMGAWLVTSGAYVAALAIFTCGLYLIQRSIVPPRHTVVVDADGVEVRDMHGNTRLPWHSITSVSLVDRRCIVTSHTHRLTFGKDILGFRQAYATIRAELERNRQL